jgi:hypothetical protein
MTSSNGLADSNQPRSRAILRVRSRRAALPDSSRPASDQDVVLADQIGRPHLLQIALQALQPALRDPEVGGMRLILHGPRIGLGPDGARRMRDRRLAESPDHVDESVGVAERDDVQKRVSGGAAGARQVGKLDGRRDPLLAWKERRQLVEAAVWHPGHANTGFQPGVAAARSVEVSRHQLEEGGLAGRREADQGSAQHRTQPILTRHDRAPPRQGAKSVPGATRPRGAKIWHKLR